LPLTSNEIPSFFFLFSSVEDDDFLSLFNPKSTFGFSIDPSNFAFDLSIERRIWILVLLASRNGTLISP
jgi:hypothetical protein